MDAKAKLLELIAGRNRGLLATESDRVRILFAIHQQPQHSGNRSPTFFSIRANLSISRPEQGQTLQYRRNYRATLARRGSNRLRYL